MNTSTIILSTLGSGGLFVFVIELIRIIRARKRDEVEVENLRLQSPLVKTSLLTGEVDKAILIMDKLQTNLQSEVDRQQKKIERLELQIEDRDRRILEMADKINDLLQEVSSLQVQYLEGQTRLRSLEDSLRRLQNGD